MSTVQALHTRLQELHARTVETPLFNPVFQVGLELSRQIECGELSLDDVAALVAELECEGLQARANRLARLVAPVVADDNEARLTKLAAGAEDFAKFAAKWQHPLVHVVFTAHPTFLLSSAQSAAVAASASSGEIGAGTTCVAPHAHDAITLDYEHDAAMAAIAASCS
jgi:phosphoenolpyruvate carboxylase